MLRSSRAGLTISLCTAVIPTDQAVFKLQVGKSFPVFQEDFPINLENCITLDELGDESDDQGRPGRS